MLSDLETDFFPAGEVIFSEGDPPGDVFFIDRGSVEIYKTIDGKKVILTTRGENEIFGEMAIVDDLPRSASVVALEDTCCYTLNELELDERLNRINPFLFKMFKSMSSTIRELTVPIDDDSQ